MRKLLLTMLCALGISAWAQTPNLLRAKQQHKNQTIYLPQLEIEQGWDRILNKWDTLTIYKVVYQNGLRVRDTSFRYDPVNTIDPTLTTYIYNTMRKPTQETQFVLRSNGDVDTLSKTVYAYNDKGNNTHDFFLSYNTQENKFDTSYGRKSEFTYDSQNRITQIQESDWLVDSNKFELRSEFEFYYIGNAQAPDSIVISNVDEGVLVPFVAAKVRFIEWNPIELFDGSKIESFVMYEYNGSMFEKSSDNYFTYNTQGDIIQELSISVDGDTSSLNIYERTYNADGALTSLINKYLDDDTLRNGTKYLYSNFLAFTGLNKKLDSKVAVYPNPATDKLHIEGVNSEAVCILFSMSGQQVLSHKLDGGQQAIDLSSLPPGVYFLSIKQDDMVERKKLIITR